MPEKPSLHMGALLAFRDVLLDMARSANQVTA